MDATGNRIMFVCTREAILANALMNKIRIRGGDPFYVHDAQQLAADAGGPVRAVVYYMNDDAGECAALHGALAAFCAERGAKAACVGSREQYDALLKDFDHANVSGFFERPLNMERFLDCLMGEADAAARKKRVLVVDDDASYREFVCAWLKGTYETTEANGGEQALKLLSARRFDLVLLDYEMPVLSGLETMKRILALPREEQPPVVFLTGNADESCVRRMLDLHPAGYLSKTVRREELLAAAADAIASKT